MKLWTLGKGREPSEDGFTLIELLVVILIIGILAAIAIPVFLNQRQKSNEASLKSDLKNLGVTMESSLVNNQGKYPSAIPSDFKASQGNTFALSLESGNTNISAGSSAGDSLRPGRIGYHSTGPPAVYPTKTVIGDYTSVSYAGQPANITGGPYWDYIPKDAAEIPMGQAFSGSVSVRSSIDVCLPLQFEQHRSAGGFAPIKGADTCLVAGEWQELTVSGTTTFATTSVTLIAYSAHIPGSVFDYKEPIIVLGSTINKTNLSVGLDQRYCVQGYHENNKTNIWHYSTLNGGVEQGTC